MIGTLEQSRRNFLKFTGLTGAGLIVGVPLYACVAQSLPANHDDHNFHANAFIHITKSNEIEFYLPSAEMGQGVYHGLTTLIAEELSTDPSLITVKFAPVNKAYRNSDFGLQLTGASTSTKVYYQQLRQASANAGSALLQAASEKLAVPRDRLELRNATIVSDTGVYPFGDFVELASQRPMPDSAELKAADKLQFIGKEGPSRNDARAKSEGTARFGIDVDFPGLKRALLKRCPVAGGTVKSHNGAEIASLPGVVKIVELPTGVAVVSDSFWQAKQAIARLEVEWSYPELRSTSSASYKQQLVQALESERGDKAHKEGAGADGLEGAENTIEATYWAPYLAHATMEPMNCTVKIENDLCEVWVGNQTPEVARGVIARHTGISSENITIHNQFLGGGFGRRLYTDYIVEACLIAQECAMPVQLLWTREDDIRHDIYRPASLAKFSAALSDAGQIDTITVTRAGPNITPGIVADNLGGIVPSMIPNGVLEWVSDTADSVLDGWIVDTASVEGLYEDYNIPNKEVTHITQDPGFPVGYWRAVGHSYSGFFIESFMDELAHSNGQDPVNFRLRHLSQDGRLAKVIAVAADKANWGKPSVPGAAHGIAAHTSFDTRVAQVAEVSVEGNQIKVHRVWCAVDCGVAVNPDIIRAQMESGIIYGLTAALYGKIEFEDGAVTQSNFHDYPVLRISETPEIEVHIISSQLAPTGVGEPGLPPIAAAVANAVYAATGQRLRALPLVVES